MRIAVVFDNMIYGGIERVGISHIKLLKDLGHQVDAYVLTEKTEAIIDELESICEVHIIPYSRKLCPETYWPITRRMIGGKYVFPVVYFGINILHYLIKPFKRVHNKYDVAIAFAGHFNDLTFVADGFIEAEKKVAWLHGALYQYILGSQGYEYLYKKIKNLVVLVDDAQEEVLAYHQKDRFDFNIRKIYNPISISNKQIDIKKVEELKDKYGDFVLMVSRLLYPHKDHYTVIKAIKILKEEYGIDRKLVLVGDGPEREKLINYSKDLHIRDNIIFEGSKDDVQNYYCACNILAHASVAGEGLPTVLLEAMDLETPVVCTDSKVGPREILGNSEYGLLTRVQDADDMAEKLFMLINNKEMYAQYKALGKKRMSVFSPESIKLKLSDMLDHLQ